MRKRTLLKVAAALCVVLLLLLAVGYAAAKVLVEDATRKALALGIAELGRRGVKVEATSFGTSELDLPRGVVLRSLSARCQLSGEQGPAGQGGGFDLRVGSVAARMLDWSARRFELTATDVVLVPRPAGGVATEGLDDSRLTVRSARLPIEVDPADLEAAWRPVASEIVELVRTGGTSLPLELDGDLELPFDGRQRRLRLGTVERDGRRVVVVDPEDIRPLSDAFEEGLTEAEVALVAENPLRAPVLLQIKQVAETTSREAHDRDPAVPEDAYRHVLWSYALTRQYGPEFAESVTDAHEAGSTTNTEADHRMDYNNNAVGRRYALAGREPAELLGLVRRDPDVIREAR